MTRLRHQVTGKVVDVPAEALGHYLSLTLSRQGGPMFKALEPIPGFVERKDGIEATMVEPDRAHEVARRMFDPRFATSFQMGKNDPRHEAAKATLKARKDKARRAQQSSASGVFMDRARSVLTGGAYTALQDFIGGEDEKMRRMEAAQNHWIANGMGTIGGMIALGLMPIPGGAAGRAAGKLTGGAPAANVHNLFELSVAGAQGARAAVRRMGAARAVKAGSGAGADAIAGATLFGESIAGATAASAIAEIPLSMAVVSADIVDTDQEWSAQAVVADGLMLGGIGIGLGVLGGTIQGAFRAGIGASGFLAETGARALAGSVARNISNTNPTGGLWRNLAVQGSIAAGRRAGWHFRGTRQAAKIAGKADKAPVSKPLGWLMGDELETFARSEMTNRSLMLGLDPTSTAERLAHRAKILDTDLRKGPTRDLWDVTKTWLDKGNTFPKFWKEGYKKVVGPLRGATKFVERGKWQVPKGLIGSKFNSGLMGQNPTLVGGLNNVRRAIKDPDIAAIFDKRLAQIGGNDKKSFVATVSLHNDLIMDGSLAARAQVPKVAEALARATTNPELVRKALSDMDEFWKYASGVDTYLKANPKTITSPRFVQDLKHNVTRLNEIHEGLEKAGFLVSRKNKKPYSPKWGAATTSKHAEEAAARRMTDEAFEEGMEALIAMNRVRNMLAKDMTALVPPRFHGKTKLDMQLMQVDSMVNFKKRTMRAMKAAAQGGIAQGAGYFGVVQMVRELSADTKRQEFLERRALVLSVASGPEDAVAVVGKAVESFAQHDALLGTHVAQVMMAGAHYLHQQLPRSDYLNPDEFSMAEMEEWLDRSAALEDPVSVLAGAADGSVTPGQVEAIRTVFPSVYIDMVLDLVEFLNTHDGDIPYQAMLGFDTFTGGALGVLDEFSPYTPPYAQTPLQSQGLGAIGQQRFQQATAQATAAQKVGQL